MYIRSWRHTIILLLIVGSAAFMFLRPAEAFDASTAGELEKALQDKKITDIRILSSMQGNFLIPPWVSKISGGGDGVVITPREQNKPVFTAINRSMLTEIIQASQSQLSVISYVVPRFEANPVVRAIIKYYWDGLSDSESLVVSNLQIACNDIGFSFSDTEKQIRLENVTIKSTGTGRGIFAGTKVVFYGCKFEDLAHCIEINAPSEHDLTVSSCSFKNSGIALFVSNNSAGGQIKVLGSRGENLSYWAEVYQKDVLQVLIDRESLEAADKAELYTF